MKNILIFCCALLAATALQAQVIHVPGDYPTIQAGINAANNGDTVLVDEGIYYEQINFMGKKPLVVASNFIMDGDTSHIGKTILDGSQITSADSGSIVYFISHEDTTSVLCGFTIRNGTKGTKYDLLTGEIVHGGGAVFTNLSGAKITYNHITQNSLVDTNASLVTIQLGAGIECGTWVSDSNWVVIEHNTIDHNICRSDYNGQAFGAGIVAVCNSMIRNNVLANNTVAGSGSCNWGSAAVFAGGDPKWDYIVTAIIQDNLISNNTDGGGMLQAISAIISGNIIENNSTVSPDVIGRAGGLDFWGPRTGTIVSKNTFRNNTTIGNGGAIRINLEPTNLHSDTVIVESNYFIGNEGYSGGGISSQSIPVVLQNNVFNQNHADLNGGAVNVNAPINSTILHYAILINNSFSENVSGNTGGAFYSIRAHPLIINSVFWNDSSSFQKGDEIYFNTSDTAEIAYSNVDGSKIQGNWTDGGGNMNADPLFTDTDSLKISWGSPCYNTGTESFTCSCGHTHICPAIDITGETRPWYGSVDVGANEFHAPIGINNDIIRSGLLCSNHPNPFTTITTFSFSLGMPCQVRLTVFNSYGQVVAEPVDGYMQKGDMEVVWDGEHLPSGIYFYRIEAEGKVGSGKVIKL